jgi:uncharacterized protein (TIGR03435 family)
MSTIEILSTQPWVERLGWTLLHFLWQGSLIASFYAGLRREMTRTSTPNTRYTLACVFLAAMLAAPLVTWSLMRSPEPVPDAAYRIRNNPPATSALPTSLPESVRASISGVRTGQFLPWVVTIWLAGAAAFWVRLAGGWVVAARMRSMLVRPVPSDWQQLLGELAARIGLFRPVRLLISGLVQVPTVIGWLRPVILVPVGALGGLPPEQVEALLIHELAHIRRHDYLVNLLQSVAEALLFYHPAVWWVSGHIRAERELCCDDVAVTVTGDVLTYARALAELESCRPAHLNAVVAANGGSLAGRIGRLLGYSRPPARGGFGMVVPLGVLLLAAAYGLYAQSDAHPAFQVASIKLNPARGQRAMYVSPQPGGRMTAVSAPLLLLIQNAYAVHSFQVVGGPSWINSEGYDIEAKPEGETTRKQMWLMLQTLLADRFKLVLHRETRELPLYTLTQLKGGLKQAPAKEGGCLSIDQDAPPPRPGSGPPCGKVQISMTQAGIRMQGGKVTMAEFIRILAIALGRPVLDKTDFAGEFDVDLDFTPDESTAGLPGARGPRDPGGPSIPTDPSRPTILAALQEQLGLKLSSGKGPVEVLAIDHVERPTEN